MEQHNFQKYLKKYAQLINSSIESECSNWNNEFTQLSPRLAPLIYLLKDATEGGKRIRGTLVCLGYRIALGREMSQDEEKEILKIAAAYEIFQTAILAHDDIIDKSALRRGKPTLYKQLGSSHYGISQTISLGDLGFFITYNMIAKSHFSSKNKARATALFSENMTKTVLGQMLDVELTHKKIEINDTLFDEIKNVYLLKTAYYTFVAPLSLGAILGNANDTFVAKMKAFGEEVGVAFQLYDDVLDIYPKKQNSTKDSGADIKEGKVTLLYAKAMQNADKETRRILSKHYGKVLVDETMIKAIQQVFLKTGALTYVQTLAQEHLQNACKRIPTLSSDPYIQKTFRELTEYVSEIGKENHG